MKEASPAKEPTPRQASPVKEAPPVKEPTPKQASPLKEPAPRQASPIRESPVKQASPAKKSPMKEAPQTKEEPKYEKADLIQHKTAVKSISPIAKSNKLETIISEVETASGKYDSVQNSAMASRQEIRSIASPGVGSVDIAPLPRR